MANFSPHANMRTHVVVVNAKNVVLTANKWRMKTYYRHSGWPGGIKSATAAELREKKPTEILRHAVHGMLPKNRLGEATMKRLRIFAGPEHRHKAQQPRPLDLMDPGSKREEA
jgi:large subunit ribosomal protein L13